MVVVVLLLYSLTVPIMFAGFVREVWLAVVLTFFAGEYIA